MQKLSVNAVNKSTLSQQVLEEFIYLLMNNKLKPGDKLPSEMEMMEDFGVSRPVLRETLSSLETLGIIKRRPRGGTYITDSIGNGPFEAMLALFINDIAAILEARMTLELGLVTIAAEKITSDELDQLKQTIESIEANVDNDYGHRDKEFHRIIAQSVSNPLVDGMIHSLLISHEKTDSLIKYREPGITIEHHRSIYEALKERNPNKAFQAMYKHLVYVRNKILSDKEVITEKKDEVRDQ